MHPTGTDGHHMYHNTQSIMASPTYSPDHQSNIMCYNMLSPGMEHDIKSEGLHSINNHHHHHHHGHVQPHDSRSPSIDGEHENGNGDHLHELQSQQIVRKMERPSVVNIKTE